MELRRALDSFYYSTALCDLRLMNRQFIDENITYNSLLYLELIYAMDGRLTASKIRESWSSPRVIPAGQIYATPSDSS